MFLEEKLEYGWEKIWKTLKIREIRGVGEE